jgi:hypothetical protein
MGRTFLSHAIRKPTYFNCTILKNMSIIFWRPVNIIDSVCIAITLDTVHYDYYHRQLIVTVSARKWLVIFASQIRRPSISPEDGDISNFRNVVYICVYILYR